MRSFPGYKYWIMSDLDESKKTAIKQEICNGNHFKTENEHDSQIISKDPLQDKIKFSYQESKEHQCH